MADEPNNRSSEAQNETPSESDERQAEATPAIVDEYGEPLADEHEHIRKRPLYRRPVFLITASVILLLAIIFGVRYWAYARAHESTDDAFIDGHIIQVSPKVPGYVLKVYVTDNQNVKAGDLLAELDARDLQAKVDQAKAALTAGLAQQQQARTQVTLTRVSTRAGVRQAAAGVQQARSGVTGARAGASSERSRTAQSSAGINTAEANMQQARAQLSAAQAEAHRANADVQRYQALFEKDEVSRQRLDQAIATARTANAQVEAANEKVAAAEAQVSEARAATSAQRANAQRAESQVGAARAQVNEALGRLEQANTAPQQVAVSEAQAASAGANLDQLQAAVDEAELQLSYAKIYAPDTGRVTRKSIEVGALVQVGQPLMAVVPGDVWVTANFKESQIGSIRPGETVDVSVDAYPGKVFKAHVDSIQAGTGSRFSLIPPENATGSYVKVVQRVPVKIVFEPNQIDSQHLLAPGMSAVPEVQIR
ncbi:MAG TPA: efflux RND transporter periplasmic adaptor subunit [Pyrinomonadaceae bacterium]|jgi:membrane fusion protein (multidrug efflux system)|nr:efflux RND transporter periplasmic adaptor subunit [Pyrinomonadaceae bacterium]